MTVSTLNRSQTFSGGQSVLTFSFDIIYNQPTYIYVNLVSLTGGTITPLVYGVGYTVSLNSSGVGGTVTISPTYSTAYNYVVYRSTPLTQNSNYSNYNTFPASTVMSNLDQLTMIDQETADSNARCLQVALGTTPSVGTTLIPTANYLLGWDPTGTFVTNYLVPSVTQNWVPSGSAISYQNGYVSIGTYDTSNGVFTIGPTATATGHDVHTETTINVTTNGAGYASIDIQPNMIGSSNYDHFVGLQSRPIYGGSGSITSYFDVINMGGVVSSGTVSVGRGMHISDFGGVGTITTNYGLYIDNISRGSTNWSIYTNGGAHLFGGNVTIQTSVAGNPLTVIYPASSSSTALNPVFQYQSSEASGYCAVQGTYQGGSSQLARVFNIQTYQNGGTSTGTICLQPLGGFVVVGASTSFGTSVLQVVGLASYANNTSASAAGLAVGAMYRNGDVVQIVH